ncbi:carbohydrate ABC transporter permease [Shouchella patagoniensis]|uniref:carbohydrate ABC transporter permease n=1 Tax=Shouchella patagoniensis TaxID=228576 RepID=UPI000994E294|nr:carbohydrate ABC transporter permease [Shouchella patagoniensis]
MRVKGWHLLLIVCLLLSFFPMLTMTVTAFLETGQLFSGGIQLIPFPPTIEHFTHVFEAVPILQYMGNSFFIATVVTVVQLFTSILAAYGFTQFTFRGREFLFYLVVASILIPIQVTMLPNYILLSDFGLVNTYAGLILPQIANGIGIFLLRQSFKSIPASLIESARVDGAGDWRRLWRILFPSVKPSVIALGILFFITTWNEYLWPLLMINDQQLMTMPLALQEFISAEGGTSWGPMMAVAFLASVPPLAVYLLLQRHIMSSFLHTGVK